MRTLYMYIYIKGETKQKITRKHNKTRKTLEEERKTNHEKKKKKMTNPLIKNRTNQGFCKHLGIESKLH